MEEPFVISWNEKPVARVTITSVDMWYVDGHFEPFDTPEALDFASTIPKLVYKETFHDWTKGVLVTSLADGGVVIKYLVLGQINKNSISMRLIVNNSTYSTIRAGQLKRIPPNLFSRLFPYFFRKPPGK